MINLVILPINPFIATTYPEITRAITLKLWPQLRKLLRRVTLIAGGWTIAVAAGLAVLGQWALFTPWIPWRGEFHSIYKPEYLPSLPLIMILLIGYGIANSFYWNRSLLLAFGKADYPLRVSFWGMLIKVGLTSHAGSPPGICVSGLAAYRPIWPDTVLILLFIGLRAVRAAEKESL